MFNQNQISTTLVGFLLLLAVLASGQSPTISGRVIDGQTGEPLVYATVALRNKPVGTITNHQGEFDFHIPDGHRNDQLVVSMLGYVDFSISVSEGLAMSPLVIRLQPGQTLLNEVTITGKLSPGEMLRVALKRIEKNYPMEPVEMAAFYRETRQVNDDYVALLEAAVRIYDKDYRAPKDRTRLRERVALVEVRRTLEYDYELEKYFSQYNLLEDLLLENFVKYRSFSNEEAFYQHLKKKRVPGYNNRPITLLYLQEPGYDLKIYIDEKFAIRKIVFKYGDGQQPLFVFTRRHLQSRAMYVTKELEFQEYQGRLYLKYIAARYHYTWQDMRKNLPVLTTTVEQALLVNELNVDNPRWISNKEKMRHYGLQFQHKAYNREFWSNYNTIKEMPLNRKAVADLEKYLPLEQQFASFRE